MRARRPIRRKRTAVVGYGETASAWTENYYDCDKADAYIHRLYSAAERWWQEARWKRGLTKGIMEDYVTASQSLAMVERERGEAIELLREVQRRCDADEVLRVHEECAIDAFLTRMDSER